MTKLGVFDLEVRYGKVPALGGVTLHLQEGERLFVSGPNGAGKSSLLKAIAGAVSSSHGRVELDGDIITGKSAEAIARYGLSMVPEGRDIFSTLTVEENLRVGTGIRADKQAIEGDISEIYDAFPILGERRHANAGGAVGRAATDAGNRAWANDQPETHDGGRALAGPGAEHRRPSL